MQKQRLRNIFSFNQTIPVLNMKTMLALIPMILSLLTSLPKFGFYFGRCPHRLPPNSIVFFPVSAATIQCGITGLVALRGRDQEKETIADATSLIDGMINKIFQKSVDAAENPESAAETPYLGGNELIDQLYAAIRSLKSQSAFYHLFSRFEEKQNLDVYHSRLSQIIEREYRRLDHLMGRLPAEDVEIMTRLLERLKDAAWCLKTELIDNIAKISELHGGANPSATFASVSTLKNINAVLNSLDRLEVRGRDSAGISLLFMMDASVYVQFRDQIETIGLLTDFNERMGSDILKNRSISLNAANPDQPGAMTSLAITYKVAAEIGRLGDNIAYIRRQIINDPIFHQLINLPYRYHTVSAHTRWASVGEISEANCHPVDNRAGSENTAAHGIIHVCLNGDIDNYQTIKAGYADRGIHLPPEISCDTKVIPMHIQNYLSQGHPIETAFRLAVNDFEGSHAISMHSDMAPGKLFLALKGSGQAIFVGLAEDHYIPTSEIYGLVEETSEYLKLDGSARNGDGPGDSVPGQIFIADQSAGGGLDGVAAMFYDGTPIALTQGDIRKTPLTSRDIDRQDFRHYFLKEISESPVSVRKTLDNRWKIVENGGSRYVLTLDESMIPAELESAFKTDTIRRILFIGQGTAGVAAQACADIMRHYINTPDIQVNALKSSELSGFIPDTGNLRETLLVPISQSGTTTDTNRTVDMMKQFGAWAVGIVNRRDSDLTFKVDGVIYTSSGRDIEMSVASTKAFYSQIMAGAILGLYVSQLTERRSNAFISQEIKQMLAIPGQMQTVLKGADRIRASAQRLAVQRTYWAAVGSGWSSTS